MYVFDTPSGGKAAWILPPKTGTRSVEKVLRDKFHGACKAGRHGVARQELRDVDLVIASIRHPCDVLRSWADYHPSGRKSKSFGHWLKTQAGADEKIRPINYLEKSTLPQAHLATEFCRYENGLEAEFNRILRDLGWGQPPIVLGHIGKAEKPTPWQELFTPDLRRIVREKYHADFERFGYDLRDFNYEF